MGKYEEAVKSFLRYIELSGRSKDRDQSISRCYARMGKREEARKILNNIIEYSKEKYFPSFAIASVFSVLGEKDQVFVWLEKAVRERDPFLLMYLKTLPAFDPVRSDPRYAVLLRKIGLEK
jgi:tetratricopeptide (TPR) repeat protein